MKILFATDGSPSSMNALAEATRFLPLGTAELTVVSVTDPSQRFGGNEDASVDLQKAEAFLVAAGHTPAVVLAKGEPAPEILATAKRLGVDLIVIGSNGRTAVGRLVMGSVSDSVVRGWHGATLVIAPKA